MMKILHITAHLGGGVGKALSGLAARAAQKNKDVQHSFVCLENPQKSQFIDKIRDAGCDVFVKPGKKELLNLVAEADILQLEWWNHPATIKCLCELIDIPVRLLAWSHVSGLHTPVIPKRLILAAHKFLFTSPCSYEATEVKEVFPEVRDKLDVVSSSGGFDDLPYPKDLPRKFSAGYIGSFNFAKLHPRFVDFLAAVDIPGFKVKMIGDLTNQDALNRQCTDLNIEGALDFRGYINDIVNELSTISVMPYLLNSEHYGTTENALIEAMAMGIVPVVLNNPTERNIIEDRITGLIVKTPAEFAAAMRWLYDNPAECGKLGMQAADQIRSRFSAEKMESSLTRHYESVLKGEKKKVDFKQIFGDDPAQWFLSCQKECGIFNDDGNITFENNKVQSFSLFEKNKGTVLHFSRYFPQNIKLKLWAENLDLDQ